MDEFRAFSLLHAAALMAVAAASWGLAWNGRQHGGSSPWARIVGVLFVIEWIAFHTWKATPPELKPIETLPLQMCHWTALAAGCYLATQLRALRPILYFWGFGLCTQALITPVLKEGPNDVIFWHFWLSHGMIVVGAVYALVAEGYRPSWRDYGIACVATLFYGLSVLPVNLLIGANYGFLGRSKPEQPTLVDWLGPWPERLLVIVCIVAGIMALLAWPWSRSRARIA
jgi:hypothetical integral membrane protein (TIGR02206 family)